MLSVLDRLLGQMQLHPDLFIAVPSGDPFEDLPLPLGKVVKRTGCCEPVSRHSARTGGWTRGMG